MTEATEDVGCVTAYIGRGIYQNDLVRLVIRKNAHGYYVFPHDPLFATRDFKEAQAYAESRLKQGVAAMVADMAFDVWRDSEDEAKEGQ